MKKIREDPTMEFRWYHYSNENGNTVTLQQRWRITFLKGIREIFKNDWRNIPHFYEDTKQYIDINQFQKEFK